MFVVAHDVVVIKDGDDCLCVLVAVIADPLYVVTDDVGDTNDDDEQLLFVLHDDDNDAFSAVELLILLLLLELMCSVEDVFESKELISSVKRLP